VLHLRFLRDDLLDKNKDFNIDTALYGADLVPEVGDIILYQDGYYEVDNSSANQYFVGKNPDYPNNVNPLNPGLEDFGSSISVICETHYVPSDKVGISRERYL
jgi:signal peptidase I